MEEQPAETKPVPKQPVSVVILYIIIGLLAAVLGFTYYRYSQKLDDKQNQIEQLEMSQLPTQNFTSYEDCLENGGVYLWTINVQFNGCAGGEAFPEYRNEDGYIYQANAFFQYSAQNLPRLLDPVTTDEDLTDLDTYLSAGLPSDCTYKIHKLVTDRFVLTDYTCTGDEQYRSLAIKLADGWRGISTTNNMNKGNDLSCLVVDMFKVSKELVSQCYENTGYNNDSLKDVTYP